MIPKLRFKGFSGEWNSHQLGDIASFQKGKGISKADIEAEGSYKCIRYGELYTEYNEVIDTVVSKTNQPITESVVSEKGDVLIPASGETAIDMATACSLQFDDIILGGDINVIRPAKKVFSELIAYSLSHSKRIQLARVAQGNSVVHIYGKHLSKLKIELPNTEEEVYAIKKILKSVNDKINLLTKKKEALETYKKGLMQKIFSQELRFKREDGTDYPEWERITIVDIAKIIGGGTPDTSVPLFWNGNINWFTPTEVGKKKYLSESKRTITNEGLMRSSAKLLPKGTILLSTRATIGETSIIRAESTTNQGFQNLVVSDSNDIEFVYYLISAMRKELLRRSSGSTFMEISKKEIAKIQCSIPILEEQQKIGLCLSSIDLKINQMDKKKEEVIKMKKGLLQQMFV